jgi:hypothetical protein
VKILIIFAVVCIICIGLLTACGVEPSSPPPENAAPFVPIEYEVPEHVLELIESVVVPFEETLQDDGQTESSAPEVVVTVTSTAPDIPPAPPPLPAVDYNNAFVLTISVEESTLPQGENFRVNAALKNNSEQDVEINYFFLLDFSIPNYNKFCCGYGCPGSGCDSGELVAMFDLPEPTSRLLEAGGVVQNTGFWGSRDAGALLVGSRLPPGTHELSFTARFWLDDYAEQVTTRSNTILLTVE